MLAAFTYWTPTMPTFFLITPQLKVNQMLLSLSWILMVRSCRSVLCYEYTAAADVSKYFYLNWIFIIKSLFIYFRSTMDFLWWWWRLTLEVFFKHLFTCKKQNKAWKILYNEAWLRKSFVVLLNFCRFLWYKDLFFLFFFCYLCIVAFFNACSIMWMSRRMQQPFQGLGIRKEMAFNADGWFKRSWNCALF